MPSIGPQPRTFVDTLPVYTSPPGSAVPLRFAAASNESPLPPSPRVVAAATAAIATGNRYPAINATDVIAALSAAESQPVGTIAVADGALSLLQYILTAFVSEGANVVYGWRSYEAYPICVAISGAEARPVALTKDHRLDLDAMAGAVDRDTAAVIVCNPNNPTGTVFDLAAFERFLEQVPRTCLVIYDEAYRDFVSPPDALIDPVPLMERFPHLVALRTFSKAHGMAGLRVGYLLAEPGIAGAVRRVIPPFPLSSAAAAAAVTALGDGEHRERIVAQVLAERDRVREALTRAGQRPVASSANFIWLPDVEDSVQLAIDLRAHGIAIRGYPGDGARISVGQPGLADALESAFAAMVTPVPGRGADLDDSTSRRERR